MGSAATHRKRRQRLRRKLAALGYDPAAIDAISDRKQQRHSARRASDQSAAAQRAAFQRRHPRLSPATVALVIDECRRQGRPVPGDTR